MTSVAQRVTRYVATLPEGSCVSVRDVSGARSAVETALSRLAASGDLSRVRRCTYWKGSPTPRGMTLPRTEEIALGRLDAEIEKPFEMLGFGKRDES